MKRASFGMTIIMMIGMMIVIPDDMKVDKIVKIVACMCVICKYD